MRYNGGIQTKVLSGATNTLSAANLLWRSAVSTIAPPRFYVYVLVRPDGTPFYVGKGSGRRVYRHVQDAKRGHKCHKCNIIRQILASGGEVQHHIVFETDDEHAAFAHEVALIAFYGRGTLANLTDGGEGASGAKLSFSPQHRARIGAANRGTKHSEATRAKMSQARKGVKQTPEWIAKRAAAKQGHTHTAESRERMSVVHKSRVTEGTRTRGAAHAKAAWEDPETRARLIAAAKARSSTPEQRKALGDRNRGRTATPETREKLRKAQQARRQREQEA